MPGKTRTRCKQQTAAGTSCRAPAQTSGYCFAHDPSLKEKRDAAQRKGGQVRSRPAKVLEDAPLLPLETTADVVAAIAVTFNDVRSGRLDVRIGNCLGVLASVQLRALAADTMAARVEAVERILKIRQSAKRGK